MISFGGSPNNISFLVVTNKKREALNAINEGVFMPEYETASVKA
jgi:hypothetical protein